MNCFYGEECVAIVREEYLVTVRDHVVRIGDLPRALEEAVSS